MANKRESWTRDPNFRKYFGTVFGITQHGDSYRLDIGNEKMKISEEENVNVAECQVILPQESFDALYGLFKLMDKDSKKKPKKKK